MIYTLRYLLICFALCSFHHFIHASEGQKYNGYPSKEAIPDLKEKFKAPPRGYGNIPFFWWNGDSLKKERLQEQLDILGSSATDGFSVSYHHLDSAVDPELHKNGFGLYGRTEPGVPAIFSDDWWEIWNWFAKACAEKGMGTGLDDYTVGWHKNGYYPDELDTLSKFKNYKGELIFDSIRIKGGSSISKMLPEYSVSVTAYPGTIDLSPFVSNNRLKWKAPKDTDYTVFIVSAANSYVLHPDHGKELVHVYFDRFEDNMTPESRKGLNYFFQDELSYPIKIGSWSEDFTDEFTKRKGYDITPYLAALKYDIGPITPKIRLDYCEVLTNLSDERYFKPVFDWHASRGLIYGCDNLGRGLNPISYVDYFRAISWFTAPGNDAPSTGSSFIQTKVSSSVAHLYNRPRTWLEAFHSMGWGSSGSWLTRQIDHHFMAGGNLVCMHGLYYTTHGSWWEWAPPCFHFRMPYWPHMKQWLSYTQRISYLMSQGNHVCDIAILYPTEPLQAYTDEKAEATFDLAMRLSNCGLDYDFIDFRSLRNAGTAKGELKIQDEKYKVILLSDMKAIHYTSLQKALQHFRSGGIVIATGNLPESSDRNGANDEDVNAIVKEIFGVTASDIASGKQAKKQTNPAGGAGLYLSHEEIPAAIRTLIVPDFTPESGTGKVLHRRIGNQDIYMVTDVTKGDICHFRSSGNVEIWDGITGEAVSYPIEKQDENGTWLRLERESSNSYLFVFSPGMPQYSSGNKHTVRQFHEIQLASEWETEFLPTLNNKWGDFRLPAFDGFIGPEARSFRYKEASDSAEEWQKNDFDDTSWNESIYGYGPQMEYTSVSENFTLDNAIEKAAKGELKDWRPLEFSWQYGVWDQPGGQGQHGLKGRVSDGFLILSKGVHQIFRTQVYAPSDGIYKIMKEGVSPDYLSINGQHKQNDTVELAKGWHSLLIAYGKTPEVAYHAQKGGFHDFRKRSAVVLYPLSAIVPQKTSPYDQRVSMRWDTNTQLRFDPYGGKYPVWNYRCLSVPGTESMMIALHGELLHLSINGMQLPDTCIHVLKNCDEINSYKISLPQKAAHMATVTFSVKVKKGFQGCSVFASPIKFNTGKGLMPAGNWGTFGSMRYYSGGLYYRNHFTLPADKKYEKVMLNLGDVVASCEVKVNGLPAGILMSPPYETDITQMLKEGNNEIEVLVYSTLSNHYQTIPTPYRGNAEAGMEGPVRIILYK